MKTVVQSMLLLLAWQLFTDLLVLRRLVSIVVLDWRLRTTLASIVCLNNTQDAA